MKDQQVYFLKNTVLNVFFLQSKFVPNKYDL